MLMNPQSSCLQGGWGLSSRPDDLIGYRVPVLYFSESREEEAEDVFFFNDDVFCWKD